LAQLSFGVIGAFSRIVQESAGDVRGGSSGDSFLTDKHAWAKVFGSRADQSDVDGVSGFTANTWGMVLGADAELNSDTRLGLAFAYAKTNATGNADLFGTHQYADVDAYHLIAYGSKALGNDIELKLQMDFGQNINHGERNIQFGGLGRTANSSYRSDIAHIGGTLEKTLELSPAVTITPRLRADYVWIHDHTYSETGASALNLNVDSNTTEAFVLGGGAKLGYAIGEHSKLVVDLDAGYDTINQQSSITAIYAGVPGQAFATKGLSHSPWLMHGGIAYVTAYSERLEFTVRYDIEGRSNFTNQSAAAKLRWSF
jgi:outer membrane autotransporter protein